MGRIYFLLVRLKIKHMELSIIRRETTGVPPNQYNESETLVRFEVSARTLAPSSIVFIGGRDRLVFGVTPVRKEHNANALLL